MTSEFEHGLTAWGSGPSGERRTIYRISYTPPEQCVFTMELIRPVYIIPRKALIDLSKSIR